MLGPTQHQQFVKKGVNFNAFPSAFVSAMEASGADGWQFPAPVGVVQEITIWERPEVQEATWLGGSLGLWRASVAIGDEFRSAIAWDRAGTAFRLSTAGYNLRTQGNRLRAGFGVTRAPEFDGVLPAPPGYGSIPTWKHGDPETDPDGEIDLDGNPGDNTGDNTGSSLLKNPIVIGAAVFLAIRMVRK